MVWHLEKIFIEKCWLGETKSRRIWCEIQPFYNSLLFSFLTSPFNWGIQNKEEGHRNIRTRNELRHLLSLGRCDSGTLLHWEMVNISVYLWS